MHFAGDGEFALKLRIGREPLLEGGALLGAELSFEIIE